MATLADGYYYLTSERASNFAVAQLLNGSWYLINEAGPFPYDEITRRGWSVRKRIKAP